MNFFDNWRMDRLFLSVAVRKESSNLTHTLRQNLCTDFSVALPCETPWMFTLFPLKQKIHRVKNVETPPRNHVGSKNKPSISISSCHSNNIEVSEESSICGLTL